MYDNSDDTFYSTGKVSFDINANEVFILIWFCVYHSKKANWTGVIFIIIISRKNKHRRETNFEYFFTEECRKNFNLKLSEHFLLANVKCLSIIKNDWN